MSTRILLLDDEPLYHKMIQRALGNEDFIFETAFNGREGLEKAVQSRPDLIITDVMMPEMNGYAFTRALRRRPEFASTPVLVLSAQSEIQDKIKSFEAGADEHLVKPFQPAELQTRVKSLLRRAALLQTSVPPATATPHQQAHLIAFHSLRGGVGNSTLAVNTALALQNLWGKRTLLMDLSMLAGEVALLLDEPIKRSWADIARFNAETLDEIALQSIIGRHESGLHFIPAPTLPAEAERISPEVYQKALEILRRQYDYLIADLPHDFSDICLHTLDHADRIVLPLAPEIASARAATLALETYDQLEYPAEKIVPVVNTTCSGPGISRQKLEKALGKRIPLVLPHEPQIFIRALNYGQPVITHATDSRSCALLEDFAFYLSRPEDKKSRPPKPSPSWERVYRRFLARRQHA